MCPFRKTRNKITVAIANTIAPCVIGTALDQAHAKDRFRLEALDFLHVCIATRNVTKDYIRDLCLYQFSLVLLRISEGKKILAPYFPLYLHDGMVTKPLPNEVLYTEQKLKAPASSCQKS